MGGVAVSTRIGRKPRPRTTSRTGRKPGNCGLARPGDPCSARRFACEGRTSHAARRTRRIPAANHPKKRDRPKVAKKWGSLAMGEVARDSGIPSAGRGQVRIMPPETAGSAGRIADNGGRYERLDVRSTVCRDRGPRPAAGLGGQWPAQDMPCPGPDGQRGVGVAPPSGQGLTVTCPSGISSRNPRVKIGKVRRVNVARERLPTGCLSRPWLADQPDDAARGCNVPVLVPCPLETLAEIRAVKMDNPAHVPGSSLAAGPHYSPPLGDSFTFSVGGRAGRIAPVLLQGTEVDRTHLGAARRAASY